MERQRICRAPFLSPGFAACHDTLCPAPQPSQRPSPPPRPPFDHADQADNGYRVVALPCTASSAALWTGKDPQAFRVTSDAFTPGAVQMDVAYTWGSIGLFGACLTACDSTECLTPQPPLNGLGLGATNCGSRTTSGWYEGNQVLVLSTLTEVAVPPSPPPQPPAPPPPPDQPPGCVHVKACACGAEQCMWCFEIHGKLHRQFGSTRLTPTAHIPAT